MVLIGAGFALASIAHSGWAIWTIDHPNKEDTDQAADLN
jgi:hypothetical protein